MCLQNISENYIRYIDAMMFHCGTILHSFIKFACTQMPQTKHFDLLYKNQKCQGIKSSRELFIIKSSSFIYRVIILLAIYAWSENKTKIETYISSFSEKLTNQRYDRQTASWYTRFKWKLQCCDMRLHCSFISGSNEYHQI